MNEPRTDGTWRDEAIMAHSHTRRLHDYWNRLRGSRAAPQRREIEPADIAPILSDTLILETAPDGRYPYRLAGSRVCALFGRELKGENWLTGWQPRDTEALATMLRTVTGQGAGAIIGFDGRTESGHAVPIEVLLLPLATGGPGYHRILGCLLPLDEPYWLGSWPVVDRTVTALRLVWPQRPAQDGQTAQADHLLQIMLPLRRLRHLALYDGGRLD